MPLAGERVLTIVSGASRGIGREIAVQMSKRVASDSVFLLTARKEATLVQIKQEILSSLPKARVWIVVCDMGSFNDDAINTFKEVLGEIKDTGSFDSAYVFHNCGTVGDVTKKSTELSNPDQWRQFLNINLVSMIQFNNLILESITKEIVKTRVIVNITSLLALQAFPSLTQYSVGKAAREAYFRGLAVEDDSVKVFNYSPGPVDTDMHDVIAKESFDEGIRQAFAQTQPSDNEIHKSKLTPTQTVVKMLRYLEDDKFRSGARIDYFDEEK
ncbi:unnamed protein product [Cylicocyclus nassatus]|uniref:Sepiapterin reductase n=1 Tax=Cylicocyclus nassatus TaxID=53992 RepID=A0AA36GXL1_CYLNA|nr:unnamed protein product [Cylicocyclus nassatus]